MFNVLKKKSRKIQFKIHDSNNKYRKDYDNLSEFYFDTSKALNYHWFVWKSVGLQPPPSSNNKRKQILRYIYIIYSIILNFSITICFPITFLINLLETKTLLDICENLNITVTDINATIKFINVFLVRRKLESISSILKVLDLKSSKTKYEQTILKNAMNLLNKYFKIFVFTFVFGISLSFFMILFTNEKVLMYPAWFPFDWRHSSINFTIAILYQLIGLIIQAWQDAGSDSYPPALLIILTAHIKTLSYRIQNIGKEANKTEDENYKELVDCIQVHKIILFLAETIQDILSIACISQLICSGIVQCTVAVYILYADNSTRIAIAVIFFFAVTFEMFVICHFSNTLTVESENFQRAILNCNWTDQSKKFRNDLLFLIQNSQKTNVILAGKYIPVSYTTFLSVLKSAYSVFTLLANLK